MNSVVGAAQTTVAAVYFMASIEEGACASDDVTAVYFMASIEEGACASDAVAASVIGTSMRV